MFTHDVFVAIFFQLRMGTFCVLLLCVCLDASVPVRPQFCWFIHLYQYTGEDHRPAL